MPMPSPRNTGISPVALSDWRSWTLDPEMPSRFVYPVARYTIGIKYRMSADGFMNQSVTHVSSAAEPWEECFSVSLVSRKILVVDDDAHIREVIRFALEKAGMQVWEAPNGRDGLALIGKIQPDLMILDILMPEMDGLEMCRELRKTSELPILFLSSRDDEIDRIIGLEIGGDDYVTKPFSPRELVARVHVILKRLTRPVAVPGQNEPQREPVLTHGKVSLDAESHTATWEGRPIALTATEFIMLQTLLRYPNRVYSRDDLMNAYAFDDVVNDRTIDSHIRRLRSKYAAAGAQTVIETVHGVGYKLGLCQ